MVDSETISSIWGSHAIWLPLPSVWKTVWFICSPKLIGKDLDLHNFRQAAIFMVVSSSNWQVSVDIWWIFSSLRLSWCFAIVLSHSSWPQHSQARAFSAEIICTNFNDKLKTQMHLQIENSWFNQVTWLLKKLIRNVKF